MFQRRRARILLAVLVFAALVLVTLDFRSGEDGPLDRARGGVTTVMRPVQDGVATLVRPFGDAASSVSELFSIRAENQRLRARVETLEERRRSMTDLQRENEELRGLLAISDRTELDTVAARTVALAPSNFEWTITIDVGADEGIERGMPVIDGDGLVGRVIQVTPTASRVLLAIDPNFSVAVRTASSGDIGTIDGRGGDPMLLRLLDPEAEIDVGDEIVTSSYQGGAFPAGIPIGTVSSLLDPTSRLSREAQVSPFVDFTRLHNVLVIRSSGLDPLPPLEGTEGFEFTPPPGGSDPEPGEDTVDEGDAAEGPDDDDDDGEDEP